MSSGMAGRLGALLMALAGAAGCGPSGGGFYGGHYDLGAGACTLATQCDDHIACTVDTCVGGMCAHVPMANSCPNGQTCVPGTGCSGGMACAKNADCSDGNVCHVSPVCDPKTATCSFAMLDKDGDGHAPKSCGGDDCDDTNPDVHPGAAEVCDGADNDCNGKVDDGATCQDPTQTCQQGACMCKPDLQCNGVCVDKTSDPQNCGACGTTCTANQTCSNGKCTCNQPLCNGQCLDFSSDSNNCGACGKRCTLGAMCAGGVCQCGGGLSLCNGQCVDTNSDVKNCGGCGLACANGASCQLGQCAQMLAEAGSPCVKNADCAGTKAVCITKNANGLVFPGGYCTSACNPAQNAMDGSNPACPGMASICSGNGNTGSCLGGCQMAGDCGRVGYSCFNIGNNPACEPTALSECDPTKKGTCPQDGGVFTAGDGGVKIYSGRVCVQVGPDPVGQCVNGCDVFAQNCPPDQGMAQGCFAEFSFGQGTCSVPFLAGPTGKDGDPCMYLNGCEPGFGCHVEGNKAVCRAFCGGPKVVKCPGQQKCYDLAMAVKQAVVGLCGP